MRKRVSIFLVIALLVLTWPLHIGEVSYLLTESVGEYFEPHKDHILFWFPFAGVGVVLLILLVVGIIMRNRPAIYGSVFAMLGALWTLTRFAVHSRLDLIVEVILAVLMLVSAVYLWRMAEQVKKDDYVV